MRLRVSVIIHLSGSKLQVKSFVSHEAGVNDKAHENTDLAHVVILWALAPILCPVIESGPCSLLPSISTIRSESHGFRHKKLPDLSKQRSACTLEYRCSYYRCYYSSPRGTFWHEVVHNISRDQEQGYLFMRPSGTASMGAREIVLYIGDVFIYLCKMGYARNNTLG
jgi:hypothetical protein